MELLYCHRNFLTIQYTKMLIINSDPDQGSKKGGRQ